MRGVSDWSSLLHIFVELVSSYVDDLYEEEKQAVNTTGGSNRIEEVQGTIPGLYAVPRAFFLSPGDLVNAKFVKFKQLK